MKFAKITLSVALLGALTLGMAEDTATIDTTTVDAQIEAIQTAPAQERVRLMNEFKQKLMTMTEEQRAEAIAAMQKKMSVNAGIGQETSADARTQAKEMKREFGEMTRERAREHAQEMQMQTNEEAVRAQTMTQQRAGNQLMHTKGAANPNFNTDMIRGR